MNQLRSRYLNRLFRPRLPKNLEFAFDFVTFAYIPVSVPYWQSRDRFTSRKMLASTKKLVYILFDISDVPST